MPSESQLYSDNPKGTPVTKGTGFASAAKARKTLRLIRKKPLAYQTQVVTTMFYRAKHHPHQTQGMRNAMQIYKRWVTRKQPKLQTRYKRS